MLTNTTSVGLSSKKLLALPSKAFPSRGSLDNHLDGSGASGAAVIIRCALRRRQRNSLIGLVHATGFTGGHDFLL